MLFPYQIDTCSPALLGATRKAADELGVGIEIHAGQNLLEFHEIVRRHGKTPVELLAGLIKHKMFPELWTVRTDLTELAKESD